MVAVVFVVVLPVAVLVVFAFDVVDFFVVVDLLDLVLDLVDFAVEALAARSSSAFSSVTASTDSPSGIEALVLPCLI